MEIRLNRKIVKNIRIKNFEQKDLEEQRNSRNDWNDAKEIEWNGDCGTVNNENIEQR